MMKHLTLFAAAALLIAAAALATSAQGPRKRIAFKKKYGEATATIRGAETLEYIFRAARDADVEIWLDHADEASAAYPKFVLYRPDGRLFYDENSVNYGGLSDLMDILPQAGDYVVRLQLPAEVRAEDKPVRFTLRIKFR